MQRSMDVAADSLGASTGNENRRALHALCPYFAMFPESLVRKHVECFTKKGDWVFDPFCGRGTTVLESLLLGRNAAGSDINPVAVCVSRAKAEPPTLQSVKRRIDHLERACAEVSHEELENERLTLPAFFRRAFYPTTLRELLYLREALDWRRRRVDRFVAALALGSLHGDMDRSSAYFSNQMPRTICLKPEYSIRYWKSKGLFPRKRKVFDLLRQKAEYRLANIPPYSAGKVRLADVRSVSAVFGELRHGVSLVITSPPYLNVTCYEEDQWLRLWFLGGEPRPTYGSVSTDDRYGSAKKYWQFLGDSWTGLAPLMKDSARMIVRLGAIGIDDDELTSNLRASVLNTFPGARLIGKPRRSLIVGRQARSFLPKSKGCVFELDHIFAL